MKKEQMTDTELVLDHLVTAVETAGEALSAIEEGKELIVAQLIQAQAAAAAAYTNLTREASFQRKANGKKVESN